MAKGRRTLISGRNVSAIGNKDLSEKVVFPLGEQYREGQKEKRGLPS